MSPPPSQGLGHQRQHGNFCAGKQTHRALLLLDQERARRLELRAELRDNGPKFGQRVEELKGTSAIYGVSGCLTLIRRCLASELQLMI